MEKIRNNTALERRHEKGRRTQEEIAKVVEDSTMRGLYCAGLTYYVAAGCR
jgi:hypothetical protein